MKGYYLYRFLDENSKVLYVGKTNNLSSRIKSHFSANGHLPIECLRLTARVEYLKLYSEFDMAVKEICYISGLRPPYNKRNIYDIGDGISIVNCNTDQWQTFDVSDIEISDREKSKPELIQSDTLLKVKMLLVSKNKSFADLSSLMGIPVEKLLYKFEYGLIKMDELIKISDYLGVKTKVSFTLKDGTKI